jgi:adenylylsulfate kinase-like enzyme
MHESVLAFVHEKIRPEDILGKDVLEVGSSEMFGGGARSFVTSLKPASYVGVDVEAGRSVDVVGKAEDLVSIFGEKRFDFVLSTEMLEHAIDWKGAVDNMKRVLRPGGILFLTARGPGFMYHAFPHDIWRFSADDFRRIFGDLSIDYVGEDPQTPGAFLKASRPENFTPNDMSGFHVEHVLAPISHGVVVWLTGIPGSGKTTIADGLTKRFARRGKFVKMFDADGSTFQNFSRLDWSESVAKFADAACEHSKIGGWSVVASASPYRPDRAKAANLFGGLGLTYCEVYLSCPVEIAAARDSRASNFGFYEAPENPSIFARTDSHSSDECTAAIEQKVIGSLWAGYTGCPIKKVGLTRIDSCYPEGIVIS